MIRRICYIAIIYYLKGHGCYQIQLSVLLNTLMMIYSGYVKPLKIRIDRRNDLFNEFMILQISLSMMFFT